MNCVEV